MEIPGSIHDADEALEYCLRPHGIMRRNVKLEENWYKDAYGPMIAFRKEDNLPVALMPKPVSGYWFRRWRKRRKGNPEQNHGCTV